MYGGGIMYEKNEVIRRIVASKRFFDFCTKVLRKSLPSTCNADTNVSQ